MSQHEGEFDALRAAWQELKGPDLTDSEEAGRAFGERADPETEACIDWMVGAWRGLEREDPEGIAPPSHLATPRRSLRQLALAYALPFAAAASLIVLVRGLASNGRFPGEERSSGTQLARIDSSAHELNRSAPENTSVLTHRATSVLTHQATLRADGGIETRSGRVRFIFLPDGTGGGQVPSLEQEN